jgi:hypothetical protein
MMMLHCKVLRGSPPIMYQFYHEDIIMGRSSAPSGGGVSFNLSLTTDHSVNYFCEADNGLGPQRSEVLTIKVTGELTLTLTIQPRTDCASSSQKLKVKL